MDEVLQDQMLAISITIAILGLIASVVAQILKPLLPSVEDDEGKEIGLRRWLPVIMVFLMTVVGVLIGLYQGEDLLLWGLNGFLAGAASVGYYAGGKALAPRQVNSSGWFLKQG